MRESRLCTSGSLSGSFSNQSCVNLVPTVSLTSDPTSVKKGGSVTLTWDTTNASSCVATGDWSGNKTPVGSGSEVITNITTSKTFTLTCSGQQGQVNVKVKVTVPIYHDF